MSELQIIEIVLGISLAWNILSTFKIMHVQSRMIMRDKVVVETTADFFVPKVSENKLGLEKVNLRIDKNRDNVKAVLKGLYSYLKIKGETKEDRSVVFTKI